jgi:hypothetical protein
MALENRDKTEKMGREIETKPSSFPGINRGYTGCEEKPKTTQVAVGCIWKDF